MKPQYHQGKTNQPENSSSWHSGWRLTALGFSHHQLDTCQLFSSSASNSSCQWQKSEADSNRSPSVMALGHKVSGFSALDSC
jgi:hypothetical protein